MSIDQIDVTKPAQGKAYTAEVRANFAAVKDALQQLQAGASSVELNIFNYLTASQQVDVKAGTLSFDSAPAWQAAIDAANVLAAYASGRSAVTVRGPAGRYDIRTQLNVKAHVNIVTDGVWMN